jgi:hypothetical protein
VANKKLAPDIAAWLKGHVDCANRTVRDLQSLMTAQGQTTACDHLQEAQYAMVRARSALEKAGG